MDFKQLGSDLLGGAAGAIGSLGVGALVNGIGSIFSHEKATPASDLLSNQYVNLGKVGNKKQSRAMESQARLAALQQYYAEKNNQQDLQNQMFMTRSAAELEAAGKRSAGLSTAGDFNGESVSSPTISSPSLPSAPMADDSPSLLDSLGFMRDVSSLMSTIKLNDSSARKNDSESDLNEIDQLTRYDENLARLDSLLQSNKISRVEYKRRKNDLLFERKSLQDRLTKEHEEVKSRLLLRTSKMNMQHIKTKLYRLLIICLGNNLNKLNLLQNISLKGIIWRLKKLCLESTLTRLLRLPLILQLLLMLRKNFILIHFSNWKPLKCRMLKNSLKLFMTLRLLMLILNVTKHVLRNHNYQKQRIRKTIIILLVVSSSIRLQNLCVLYFQE